MFYSSEAAALRTLLKDRLGLSGTDIGDGWMIFDPPAAELGVHPTESGSGRLRALQRCRSIATTSSRPSRS